MRWVLGNVTSRVCASSCFLVGLARNERNPQKGKQKNVRRDVPADMAKRLYPFGHLPGSHNLHHDLA